MSRQEFRTADKAKLQVALDPTATTNLVANPVPLIGTYLWTTPNPADSLTSTPIGFSPVLNALVSQFRLITSTGSPPVARYAKIPITPGAYAGISVGFYERNRNIGARAQLIFSRADGSTISTTDSGVWQGQDPGADGFRVYAAAQAPADAVAFGVHVQTTGSLVDGKTLAGDRVNFSRVAARVASTLAAVQDLQFTEPVEWRDILGASHQITASHNGLDVGTLSAVLHDVTLDPATSTALRPGRAVRLMAQPPDGTGHLPVWSGTILRANTAYDMTQVKADRRARITISAANTVAQASNVKRPQGVANIAELAYIFEAAGVPWAVNGSGTQPAGGPNYVTPADPARTLLDQVAITRDTARGYAWVDRRGVLNVSTAAARPTDVAATLTEADYTALAVDFDTARVINTVTVKALRDDGTGKVGEVVFGPYRDEASVKTWGAFSTEVTVQGLTDAQIATYAADLLAANSTPAKKVNSLRFPVRTWNNLAPFDNGSKRALLDTYDRVRITGADGLDQTLRVTKITHNLTAGVDTDKWTVDLEFGADAGAAAPIAVPAPPGASIPAGASRAPLISAEFTASSGSLAPGVEANVTVTHNLGALPSVVAGHLEDGFFATQIAWRVHARSTTSVTFNFRNNGSGNSYAAVLRFRLVY